MTTANSILPSPILRLTHRGLLLPLMLLAALQISACGSEASQEPSSAQPRVVTGSVVKGPLQDAVVTFYEVDSAGNEGALLTTTPALITTDPTGAFTVSFAPPVESLILVKTSGGFFYDESDPDPDTTNRRKIGPLPADAFETVLPANATTLTITPYTHALLIKTRAQAAGSDFPAVYAAVLTQATQAFGFNPVTLTPADPISPSNSATAAQKQYAILLGAAAQTINANAVSAGHLPGYADVIAFINALAAGGITQEDLDNNVRRFRNNNSSAYQGVLLPTVNLALLSQPAPVQTGPLLPFLSGDGNLKLLDPTLPININNPELLASSVPGNGNGNIFKTLFTATISGGIASDIRPARLVYVKSGKVFRVNLERGQNPAPIQVSSIPNACRLNGVAENIPNPDLSILRIDTAGTDNLCDTADDNTAPAFLVRADASAATGGVQIGAGQCCGITGITDGTGTLIGVLSPEDDGAGTTFVLNRRNTDNLFSIAIPPIATLEFSGTGPAYSSHPRGLGDQNIYLRMRLADAGTTTFKLFRYDVAGNSLTTVYDYGVSDSTGFKDFRDESPYDASNLYLVDGAKIVLVPHIATSPVTAPLVTAPGTITRLDQTSTHLVYEAHDFVAATPTGGVFSVLKTGGAPSTLAADDPTPTVAFLHSVDRDRVYISLQSISVTPSYVARVVNVDGSNLVDNLDAQWAGEIRETTLDLQNDFNSGIQARNIFLREGASTSFATLKLVDPLTGSLTGNTLGTVSDVMPGASVFGFGFGRFAQITAFKTAEDTDIYLGDTQINNLEVLPVVSDVFVADDLWLLDGEGGGVQ